VCVRQRGGGRGERQTGGGGERDREKERERERERERDNEKDNERDNERGNWIELRDIAK